MKPAGMLMTVFFSVLLDAFAAGIVAFLFADTEKAQVFALTFAIMLLAPFILGAWNLLKFWIGYALFLKSRLKRIYLAELNRHTLPSAAHHYDGTSYLNEVIQDATELPSVRARAALVLGELQAARAIKPFSLGMGSSMAFEAAMSQYERRPDMFSAMTKNAKIAAIAAQLENQASNAKDDS
ncbi:hypothetical protein GOD47_01380 [Sinorhizobium medicae]|nr:hypothetical protein [Sinorhizobium medicae]MDX0662678.1 hypothetical protein [Sinorhizobium medicae]MDX0723717.1 hypothetical protein [Sinorhizobium medicae]MDX0729803.1 hypothetical protein [Sinorhizobium medicae]MDX0809892.1 hypothetical protein [Sinorhizobium medicae]